MSWTPRPGLLALLTAETGGTAPWAGFNVMLAANMLREAAAMTTQIHGRDHSLRQAGFAVDGHASGRRRLRRDRAVERAGDPRYPRHRHGARLRHTVILKASEQCPGLHVMIGQVMVEAGLPAGVVNVITNAPEDAAQVVEALIAAPEVKRVNFTGSTRVGRIIGELCGRHLSQRCSNSAARPR